MVRSALLTYATWSDSPEIHGDLIGPDRERAEKGVIEFLAGELSGAGV
jgi:hypothetical protein